MLTEYSLLTAEILDKISYRELERMWLMLLKNRNESHELLVMQSLYARMELADKERFRYLTLKKGYEGELNFDSLVVDLQEERLIVNDILLEVNNSYFQIDSFIISQGVIHLLDIKNFEGDYYYDSGKFYSVTTGRELKNPIDQLKRSTALFRQFLHTHKLNYLVEPFVIFINPEFTLYQAPMDEPIIFPTQLNRFLRELNDTPSTLNDRHKILARKIMTSHQSRNPFNILPEYQYDQLQKGIYCSKCTSFQLSLNQSYLVCEKCGEKEKVELAVLRNVKEFQMLLPDRKLTTTSIYEWCNGYLCKRTYSRILKKHYTAIGNTSNMYYQ